MQVLQKIWEEKLGLIDACVRLIQGIYVTLSLPGPRSDHFINSPYNSNTLSSRQLMRIRKIITI